MTMKLINKYWRVGVTLLFGVAIFLFWKVGYPQAMSYQEQNQLFLFSWDYLWKDLSTAGGLSVWLGEFFVQFYYVEWMGAMVLTLVYIALQWGVWAYMRQLTKRHGVLLYVLSYVPPLLLLFMMGDYNLLLSFPIGVLLAVWLAVWMWRRTMWWDVLLIPIAYWLVGSTMWLYVVLRMVQCPFICTWQCALRRPRRLWMVPYLLALQLLVAYTVMEHWSVKSVILGVGYYRIPIPNNSRMWGYNKDVYEILRQDYLVRNERWDEIIERAEKYEVKTAFSSVCVNLALAKKRQLADRMFDFYQSGRDALIIGIYRDNTSDLSSMEAFWHLAMINSCLRYAFDMQEAILNAKRSGRLTKRLAECYVVNGRYDVARKHLSLLKQSLFYRRWAKDMERLMMSEEAIDTHPLYGQKRRYRFKTDFLYNYNEIDKVFGRLFVNEPENVMALDYFMAQMLLRGSVHSFMQHMSWVEQYGGYRQMPRGYQDALRYIQARGKVENSPYGRYVEHMRSMGRLKGGDE